MSLVWKPTEEWLKKANISRLMQQNKIGTYEELIRWSVEDVPRFWRACVDDLGVEWDTPYETVYDDSDGFPWTRWFLGGKINIVHNCLDRHLKERGDSLAILWEGDGGEIRKWTYKELSVQVSTVANTLQQWGVKKGDAVGLYFPMLPEVVASLFACFKIGAVAVPIFSGFGPEAVASRLNDCKAKVLITTDGVCRRGKKIPIKPQADLALQSVPSVKHVLVFRHTGETIEWKEGRDFEWVAASTGFNKVETLSCDSEDPC